MLSLSVTVFLVCYALNYLMWRLDERGFFDQRGDVVPIQTVFLMSQIVLLLLPSVIIATVVFAFPRFWIALSAMLFCAALMLQPMIWIRAGVMPPLAMAANAMLTVLVPLAVSLATRRRWLRYAADKEPTSIQFGLAELIVFIAVVAAICACLRLINSPDASGILFVMGGHLCRSFAACAAVALSLSGDSFKPVAWAVAAWIVYVLVELALIEWPEMILSFAWMATALLGFLTSMGIRWIGNRRMQMSA